MLMHIAADGGVAGVNMEFFARFCVVWVSFRAKCCWQVTGRECFLPAQDGVAAHEVAHAVDEAAGFAGGDEGVGRSGEVAFADGVGKGEGEAVYAEAGALLPGEAGRGHGADGVGVCFFRPAGGIAGQALYAVGGDAGCGPAAQGLKRLAGVMAREFAGQVDAVSHGQFGQRFAVFAGSGADV